MDTVTSLIAGQTDKRGIVVAQRSVQVERVLPAGCPAGTICAICSGRSAGSGVKSTALTPLKIVVVPRMPSASVRTATIAKVGGAHQRPNGVVKVLPHRGEAGEAALGAMGFHRLGDAAKLTQRRVTRLLRRHALPHVLVSCLGKVRVDLGAQLPLASCAAAEETEKARQKDSRRGHDGSS
jgi:hypothetical protein